jgi:hypothetical protein
MSTVLVVAPLLVANWPAITAAVAAAVASMGFAVAREGRTLETVAMGRVGNRAEIEVENSEILSETAGVEQEIVVERAGITARFNRDARGALRVCVEGGGLSKSELRALGEDLIGRVTQQYVYNRLINEMKEKNMAVVHEEVDEDRTVRIRVRNW